MAPIIVEGDDTPAPVGMRAVNAAAVDALQAVMPAERVHRVGEVPASPVTGYAVVSVSSGAATANRGGAVSGGSTSHRLVVQAVGRSVDEVAWVADKADVAFLDRPLAVPERRCTPAHAEVSSPIVRDPDAGEYLSVTLTYTFASTPA